MAEIFIDNHRFEYDKPGKVLQFILDKGLDLPYFCYHPEMSIPGNCRQCLVEAGSPIKNPQTGEYDLDENGERIIRYFPKLMIACSLDMADEMVIKTHVTSDLVKRAQKDNLEFILINHPLDCPICDQAGECPLQIQTYKYGPEGSRFEFKKVHKPKRVQLGPRVILDAERCINCTRCVRFTDEISKSKQLTIFSRGDKNYPITAPGKPFDDPYSINTVDLCPVGALTSANFRFKARVWEMNQTPSIDITNGKGCNIDLWTRDNLVLRITPRYNPHVNSYWMPDIGREAYKLFNENRISKPEILADNQNHIKTTWNNAFATLNEWIEDSGLNIAGLGSSHASLEENYTFKQYIESVDGTILGFIPHIDPDSGDNFLLSDDQAPNSEGCRFLGLNELSNLRLTDKTKLLIVLSEDIIGRELFSTDQLKYIKLVYLGTNYNATAKAADLIVPITCAAEHSASYINVDGRIQRSIPAKETMHSNRQLDPEMSAGRLDRFGTKFDNWRSDKNRVDCYPLWQIVSKLSDSLDFNYSEDVLDSMKKEFGVLTDVSYSRIDNELGIPLENSQTEV